LHGLLHIAKNIRDTGPVWTAWTFYLERYCGDLKLGIHSKSEPWATLDKRVLYTAYLEQLYARYDLEDELSSKKRILTRGEIIFHDCEFIYAYLS
jgi:hypothetical protein